MPRRNHRGGTSQVAKPKGGRVRRASFWHAIAAGIRTQSSIVADFDVWYAETHESGR